MLFVNDANIDSISEGSSSMLRAGMAPHFAGLAALGTRGAKTQFGRAWSCEMRYHSGAHVTSQRKHTVRNDANATQAPPRRDLSKKNIHGGT